MVINYQTYYVGAPRAKKLKKNRACNHYTLSQTTIVSLYIEILMKNSMKRIGFENHNGILFYGEVTTLDNSQTSKAINGQDNGRSVV